MKRKKILCLLTAVSLIAGSITGCSGDGSSSTEKAKSTDISQENDTMQTSDNETSTDSNASESAAGTKEFENKELNIAVFQGGYGDTYWKELISEFEAAYPGVKVNMEINPKMGEIVKPQIISGNAPDLLSLNDTEASGVMQSMIKEKLLLDLTDVFNEKALDRDEVLKDMMIPGMLESTKFSPYKDGKVYLAPFNYGAMGFVFNKNLFEEKGWDLPETWEEFFALGKELEKEENYVTIDGTPQKRSLFTYQGIYPSYLEEVLFPAIVSGAGKEAMDKICAYEEGSMTDPKVVEVLDMFQKISREGLLMPGTVALNHTQAQTDMMLGKSLFIVNGNWMENEMKDSPREEGFEFGMMAPPVIEKGSQRYALSSYEQLSIPTQAKNPELAKEFLKFMYTDKSMESFAKNANSLIASKHAKELAKPYLTPGVYDSYSVFDTADTMLINWDPIPKGSKVIVYTEIFEKCVTPVMNLEMTAEEWAQSVEKSFTQIRLDREAVKE